MATLDWHVTGEGGVTLVSLLVTSGVTERIQIENRLDGPVWPPRRQGVPEEGWVDGGFEGTVSPGERLVLGYASPADPAEPPAHVASAEPVAKDDPGESVDPREVIRTLGDPRPPRDAVPIDGTDDQPQTAESAGTENRTGDEHAKGGSGRRAGSHAATDAWLDEVRERLDDAERLARASSVPEATEAVGAVGGSEDVAELRSRLDADRERLQRLAAESERLSARIEGVEVPVEALQRLA